MRLEPETTQRSNDGWQVWPHDAHGRSHEGGRAKHRNPPLNSPIYGRNIGLHTYAATCNAIPKYNSTTLFKEQRGRGGWGRRAAGRFVGPERRHESRDPTVYLHTRSSLPRGSSAASCRPLLTVHRGTSGRSESGKPRLHMKATTSIMIDSHLPDGDACAIAAV